MNILKDSNLVLQDKVIAITGATGFIGSNLAVRLVALGCRVLCVGRRSSDFSLLMKNCHLEVIRAESTDEFESLFKRNRIDALINCATYFHAEHRSTDIEPIINAGFAMPVKLIDALAKYSPRAVFLNTGSSWQHFNDHSVYSPTCLHSAVKEALAKCIQFYEEAYDLGTSTLKLFDTYGPNDRRRKVVNVVFDSIATNTSIEMTPGEQLIDIVYVSDVVEAYVIVLRELLQGNFKGKSFGVSSGEELSLRELVSRICKVTGGNEELFTFGARKYRPREVMKNWRSGMEVPPTWRPNVSLDEGIKIIHGVRSKC